MIPAPRQHVDTVQQTAEVIAANLTFLQSFAAATRGYYTSSVNLETIVTWLLQFSSPQLAASALQVLTRLHYIDSNKLVALLETAIGKIPPTDVAHARFCAAGHYFDSSALVAYEFSKHLGLSENELAARWIDLPRIATGIVPGSPLIIIDDNLASGIQFRRLLSELHPDHAGPREHFPEPLSAEALGVLRTIPIYVAVAVELGDGGEEVERFARDRGLALTVVSGHTDLARWLDYGGPLWTSRQESLDFIAFAKDVARGLFADKHWGPELVESRLLGYGNAQKLTVFSHNIPKTLLPLFWKFGRANNHNWMPLFPERSEWQKHQDEIVNARPELRYIARLIASGGIGKGAASCSAAFVLDNASGVKLSIEVPDDDVAKELAVDLCEDVAHIEPMHNSPHTALLPFAPPPHAIQKYNAQVAKYNQDVDEFVLRVSSACNDALRLVAVRIRVYNDGTATASEVVLTLELPEEVEYFDGVPDLPLRPEKPNRPTTSFDYYTTIASSLRAAKFTLSSAANRRVRQTRDRGRKLLDVFVGKIVPTTFRDVTIEFLRVPPEAEIQFPYRLSYEEASRPTDGTLYMATRRGRKVPDYVEEAWKLSEKRRKQD